MALTCDSALSLLLDADLDTVTEPGHGGHIRPTDVTWAATNVSRTEDWRGFFLTPIQSAAAWRTTTTASTAYERMRLSDWTQTAGAWAEREWNAAGDWWLALQGTTGTLTTTGGNWSGASGTVQANAGFCLDAWVYGAFATTDEVLRVTFGNGKYQLSVTGMGIASLIDLSTTPDTLLVSGQVVPDDATHGPIRLMVIPMMRRAVYIFGTGDKSIVWEDTTEHPETEDRTAPDAATPLVPAGAIAVQAFRRCLLQFSEVSYPASGLLTATTTLPYVPTGALALVDRESNSLSWKDVPTGSSLTITAPGYPATPADENLPLSAAFTPTTDGHFTPVLYGVGFGIAPVTDSRVVDDSDVIASVLSDGFRLDADEERTTVTVPLKNAETLRAANNRVALLQSTDGDEIVRGYAVDPQTPDLGPRDACVFTIVDEWDRLDGTLLPNTHQFDGMLLTDAIEYILEFCGLDSTRWDIEASTFRLPPKSMNGPSGESDALIQPGTGQTAGEFLRYLRDTYSSRRMHFASVGGTVKFVFAEESSLSATPVVDLYTTTAAAVLAGADARYTVRDWQSQVQRPEANEVWVIGREPGGAWLYAPYIDTASQDPTTPEASRASNWLGERRVVILIDPSLSTQGEVNAACSFLAARTVWAIQTATFTTEWHPQVQRFNSITVDGTAYVVRDYGVDMRFETRTDFQSWRPCQYRVEKVLYA